MLSISSTSVAAAAGPGDASEMVALSGLSAAQHRRAQAEAAQERQNQKRKRCRPSCGCLAATVFVTLLGTAALASSIFTDHWERIDYDANRIEIIANQFNGSHRLTWLFNRTVAQIVLKSAPAAPLPPTTTTLMERSAAMAKSGGSYRSSSYWSSSARRQQDLAAAAAGSGNSGGRFIVAEQQQQPLTTTTTTVTAATTKEIDETITKSSVVTTRTRNDRRRYSEQQLLQVVVNNNSNGDEESMETETVATTTTNKVKRSLTYELAAINKSPPPHRRTRINAVHSHQQHQLEQLAAGRRKKRSRVTVAATSATMPSKTTKETSSGLIYLIPLHGGIFSLCIDLEKNQLQMLQDMGFNRNACTGYLAMAEAHNSQHNPSNIAAINADLSRLKAPNGLHHYVQSKMHNLSISCAVVCVILLGSAAILGTFGIWRRELSAVLVTGVMYILAALFAVFSLVIMHCKRNARRETGIIDDLLVNSTDYNESRVFSNSWSMVLGWLGSGLIFFASLFWLFLAKVMRYTPLTFF